MSQADIFKPLKGVKPRVAFFGNHDVGICALECLLPQVSDLIVVAHPPDPEDGVQYQSVFEFAAQKGLARLRGRAKDTPVLDAVTAFAPDLIWITDYRYLLPSSLLALSHGRAINLHPSLLPKYRGRAPVNWALINNEKTVGLTAHVIDEGMDTGNIAYQLGLEVAPDDTIGDVLEGLYPLYRRITRETVREIYKGTLSLTPQDHAAASTFPARKPADGLVDWTRPADDIHNLIRAVTRPYPGAFSYFQNCPEPVHFWKSQVSAGTAQTAPPGTLLDRSDRGLLVQSGDGAVLITDYSVAHNLAPEALQPGLLLSHKGS